MRNIISKKNIFFFSLFILFFAFLLFPLFHHGIYISHDGQEHLVRIAAYEKALKSGNFPVRWAANLNYTYGSPLFIFFYPLPYYLGVVVHALGFTLETTFKILAGIFFISSLFTFYFWTRIFTSKKVAFTSALIYLLSPYHFLDMYVRGDIGELLGYALLPLVFYFFTKNAKSSRISTTLLGGVCFGLLILSHNGISLIFTPVLVGYILLTNFKNYRALFYNAASLITGILFSAFFWLPALYEKKYIISLSMFDFMYKDHFATLSKLFYSPWGFGTDIGKPGGLSPQIGFLQIVIFLFALVSLFFLKKNSKHVVFWLLVGGVGIFLSLPFSGFLYSHIKLLRDFQFPWRFLVLAGFSSAAIFPYISDKASRMLLVLVCCLFILQSTFFIKVSGYQTHSDGYYVNSHQVASYHAEAIPMWTEGDQTHLPKSYLELIAGQGEITDFKKIGTVHSFIIDGKTQTGFLDNTTYYPGWQAKVDGARVPIQFQDAHHRGLITFDVSAGKHSVVVEFKETSIRLFSDIISFVTLVAVLAGIGVSLRRRYVI